MKPNTILDEKPPFQKTESKNGTKWSPSPLQKLKNNIPQGSIRKPLTNDADEKEQ